MSQNQDITEESAANELPSLEPQPIVAKAGRYYRNARFLLAGLLIAFSGWCYYDGFVAWPKHNQKVGELKATLATLKDGTPEFIQATADLQKLGSEYGALSIRLNQNLTFILPLLGLSLAAFAVYRSRGEVRLENDTFTKPGQSPVALKDIVSVDTVLWDRKGIARATYKKPDGSTGLLVLDDFVYDQKPIDAMYEHILSHLKLR
jgi:hypothetical protein